MSKERPPWWPTEAQKDRADQAHKEALAEAKQSSGISKSKISRTERIYRALLGSYGEDVEQGIADALTEMRHLADEYAVDFEELCRASAERYAVEVGQGEETEGQSA